MRHLVWLGLLVGMLSCSKERQGIQPTSGQIDSGDATDGNGNPADGNGNPAGGGNGNPADGNGNPAGGGNGNPAAVNALPHVYEDDKITWNLSHEEITIGQPFSVRIDVDFDNLDDLDEKDFRMLYFKLVKDIDCNGFFVQGEQYAVGNWGINSVNTDDPNTDDPRLHHPHITASNDDGYFLANSGGTNKLVIIGGIASPGIFPNEDCQLGAKVVYYPDKGSEEEKEISSTRNLKLRANPLALGLGDTDLDDFRSGFITASVKISSDFLKSFSEAEGNKTVRFRICPDVGQTCMSVDKAYSADMLDGKTLKVKSLDFRGDVSDSKETFALSDGVYWIAAIFHKGDNDGHADMHGVVASTIKLTSDDE